MIGGAMPSCALLIEVFVVWLLCAIAAGGSLAVKDARRGIPEGQRRGYSMVPLIPLFPLAFWGLAMLVDLVIAPWGTAIVAWLHAALGVFFLVSIARSLLALRSIEKEMKR
jgi:hypothetical protein